MVNSCDICIKIEDMDFFATVTYTKAKYKQAITNRLPEDCCEAENEPLEILSMHIGDDNASFLIKPLRKVIEEQLDDE